MPQLSESSLHPDPITQFRLWQAEAAAAGTRETDRMTLATATPDGRPSARFVLLRGLDERGFVFFTNLRSRKAHELEANPRASLVFHWPELHRQVRIEGAVERIPSQESDAYFDTRPIGSRLSAIASPQSEVVTSRADLERRVRELIARHRSAHARVRRPEHWGGYRVIPDVVEFWQRRRNRLHDRLRDVEREDGGWRIAREAP